MSHIINIFEFHKEKNKQKVQMFHNEVNISFDALVSKSRWMVKDLNTKVIGFSENYNSMYIEFEVAGRVLMRFGIKKPTNHDILQHSISYGTLGLEADGFSEDTTQHSNFWDVYKLIRKQDAIGGSTNINFIARQMEADVKFVADTIRKSPEDMEGPELVHFILKKMSVERV